MYIKVFDEIGDRATDMQQGDTICKKIIGVFSANEIVEVDFSEMKTILSTFAALW